MSLARDAFVGLTRYEKLTKIVYRMKSLTSFMMFVDAGISMSGAWTVFSAAGSCMVSGGAEVKMSIGVTVSRFWMNSCCCPGAIAKGCIVIISAGCSTDMFVP